MFKIALRQAFPIPVLSEQTSPNSLYHQNEIELAVEISGEQLNETGMLYDFFELKISVQSIVQNYCSKNMEQNSHAKLLQYMKASLEADLPKGLLVENLTIVISKGCELALSKSS